MASSSSTFAKVGIRINATKALRLIEKDVVVVLLLGQKKSFLIVTGEEKGKQNNTRHFLLQEGTLIFRETKDNDGKDDCYSKTKMNKDSAAAVAWP